MATNTTNYGWTKPSYEDAADIEVINGTIDNIDAQVKTVENAIPTTLAELSGDSTHRTVTDTEKATWNAKADVADIPTVPITAIQKNGIGVTPVSGTVNIIVPTTAADVSALPDTTKYATALSLTINSSTFVMTGQLKDQNGDNLGTAQTIDLPLESVVVNGSYNNTTKKVVLTLQNGNIIEFSVADLVAGLQTELSTSNKLNPAYIDYDSTHRAVSDTEKSTWNSKQNALTTAQLAAVNSGITSTDVDQIETNKNNNLSNTAEINGQQNATTDTVAGRGYAIINGQRLYMGTAQTPERTGDIWLDGATVRESEYLLTANPLCGIEDYKDTLDLATGACTRQIKKLVLTGQENWNLHGFIQNLFYIDIINDGFVDNTANNIAISTEYKQIKYIDVGDIGNGEFAYGSPMGTSNRRLLMKNSSCATVTDFTAYLTQQYDNGTPVCVWYILATSTTETITVPTGNTGTVEGYLIQDGIPTPTDPIYPTANQVPVWG